MYLHRGVYSNYVLYVIYERWRTEQTTSARAPHLDVLDI
jgi:hypothetical protein